MSRSKRAEQIRYFERVAYRSPQHPAAQAYALPKVEHIARFVPLDNTATQVLDVGCGNGVFSAPLAARTTVVGLDLSRRMLQDNPCALLVNGLATQLPFADGSFDVVFEANLLHHTDEPVAVLAEMKRVTSRYVVLIEPNMLNPLLFFFCLLIKEERGGLRYTEHYVKTLVGRAGLNLIRCSSMGLISQNHTPAFLIPILKYFNREFRFGEYTVTIAQK